MDQGADGFQLKTTTCTELLDGLRSAGNRVVWQQFVDRYRPMIERYATRLGMNSADAQDAAQQTLISFCSEYQSGKYDRDRGRLRVWLFGIARNQIRNLHRRSARKERQVVEDASQTGFFDRQPDDNDLEREWDKEWRDSVIRQCIEEVRNDLDAKSIEAFELFAWKGLDAAEVGRRLDMSPNAVFIAKHRILKRIRKLQGDMEDIW
jgi:RNA polymerase sigma factor (sigma-70 family)